jgi:chemotaxis protein MotA
MNKKVKPKIKIKPKAKWRLDRTSIVGAPLAVGVVLLAQLLGGGRLKSLLQAEAAVVVFGGTVAALLISYPWATLRTALTAMAAVFATVPVSRRKLVTQFTDFSLRVRHKGVLALEPEIAAAADPFLARALTLLVDGFPAPEVKHTLEVDSRMREDVDEESAQVLEAAAGYAPTLGILGAVLGLIHVMENLTVPAKLGPGIAVAFVATIYGVGVANLVFLPLATKLRTMARAAVLTREIIIEGVGAIQRNMNPRRVEEHLAAYVVTRRRVHEAAA